MKYFHFIILLLLAVGFGQSAIAQDDDSWRDNTPLLTYSPRYFGPNAFPLPDLHDGTAAQMFEVELRGEYHHYQGDNTRDLFSRFVIPVVRGRAGIEVSWILRENYKLTEATRDERHAVDVKSPVHYGGDVVVTSFFQLLKSKKIFDATVTANIKTASGGRLCDARFTDAAAYWLDMTVGRNLWEDATEKYNIRLQVMGGFYCWETNKIDHRQNDAALFAGGLSTRLDHFFFQTDLIGFRGYENNGDRPLKWRNTLRYQFSKNIISLRFNHGMKDSLYDSYSVGYSRCF